MSILNYTREQIEGFVSNKMMRPENLKHYDVCKALASGSTQNAIAEKFNLSESRVTRYIKGTKCPECGNTRKH